MIRSFSFLSSASSDLILTKLSQLQSIPQIPFPPPSSFPSFMSLTSFVLFTIFLVWLFRVTTQLCRLFSYLLRQSLNFSSSRMLFLVSSSSCSIFLNLSVCVLTLSELFLRSNDWLANPFICCIFQNFSIFSLILAISFSSFFTLFSKSTQRSSWYSLICSLFNFISPVTFSISLYSRFISCFNRFKRYSSAASKVFSSSAGGSSFFAKISANLSVKALICALSCSFSCSYLQSIFLSPSSCLQLSSSSSFCWQQSPFYLFILLIWLALEGQNH